MEMQSCWNEGKSSIDSLWVVLSMAMERTRGRGQFVAPSREHHSFVRPLTTHLRHPRRQGRLTTILLLAPCVLMAHGELELTRQQHSPRNLSMDALIKHHGPRDTNHTRRAHSLQYTHMAGTLPPVLLEDCQTYFYPVRTIDVRHASLNARTTGLSSLPPSI